MGLKAGGRDSRCREEVGRMVLELRLGGQDSGCRGPAAAAVEAGEAPSGL